MKKLGLLISILCMYSCGSSKQKSIVVNEIEAVNTVLNSWHQAAANADFDNYFSKMTDDSIFIGTDATENWELDAFKVFSKPYFNKGKAWSFIALERHVFLSENGKIAWFDELLDTQMELCRGSGVLVLTKDGWKIKHYVLSIAIPNDIVSEVITLKKVIETKIKSEY